MRKDLSDLGRHFIVGLAGPTLLPREEELLKLLRPLGIILFAKNIADGPKWIAQVATLITQVKSITENEDLIVSVDHEGGRVNRFPQPVTKFPYACDWATNSFKVARAISCELRALGFNLNFAPVLDIHSESSNPVIGARAFGSTPEAVIDSALHFKQGAESQGMLACGKHFPGHGATKSDSHLELPYLSMSKEELFLRELKTFAKLIENGIPMLMSAHVCYQQLDPNVPATFSKAINTDILRSELNFNGALITDDLEMKALAEFSPSEKALQALASGVDILLQGNVDRIDDFPLNAAIDMAEGMRKALKDDTSFADRLAESKCRIEQLLLVKKRLQTQAELHEYPIDMIGSEQHLALLPSVD